MLKKGSKEKTFIAGVVLKIAETTNQTKETADAEIFI